MAVNSPENAEASSRLVCLVDADESLTRRLADLLAPLGADVRTFSTAGAMLAECGEEPLCVVSEIRLPDMTGVELIEKLQARGVHAPVILLAAESDVATAVTGMRAGALDFIEKPHVDRLLAWHVRRLLEGREPPASDPAG